MWCMFLSLSDILETNVVIAIAAGLIGVGGVISTLLFLNDEGVSRKSVLSTVVLMCGIVIAAVSFYFDSNAALPALRFVHSFILIAFVLIASVLALLGLLDIYGRTHAAQKGGLFVGITLGLGTLAVALGGYDIYRTAIDDVKIAAVDYDAQYKLDTEDDPILKELNSDGETSQDMADKPKPKPYEKLPYAKDGVEELPYYNCQFTAPGKPYREAEITITKDNRRKQMVYIWHENEIAFQVVAIRGWTGSHEQFARHDIKLKTQSSKDAKIILEPETQMLNGLSGYRYELEINGPRFGERIYESHWCTVHNGFMYHLIASGIVDKRFTIVEEAKKWFSQFEVMDPDKVVFADPDIKPVVDRVFTDKNTGITILTPDDKWGYLEASEQFGDAVLVQSSKMMVGIGRAYVGEIVPDVAYLSKSILGTFSEKYENRTPMKPLGYQGVEDGIGIVMSLKAQHLNFGEPTPAYYLVFYQKPYVYTLYVVTYDNHESTQQTAQQVLKQFKTTKPDSFGLEAFSKLNKRTQMMMMNMLLINYTEKSLYEEARACCQLWYDLMPDEHQAVRAYLNSLSHHIDPAEGMKKALKLKSKLGDDFDLNLAYIRIMVNNYNLEAAAERLGILFKTDQINDMMMKEYVDILVAIGESEDAVEICKTYMDKQTNVNPFVRAAYVYAICHTPGRQEEGRKLLRDLLNFNVNDATYQGYVLGMIFRYGDPVDGLRLMERLEKQYGELGDLRMYRVDFLIKLKRYQEAMANLEFMEKNAPTSKPIQQKIAFVESRMGEGRYAFEEVEIEPLPLPEALSKVPELNDETLVKEHDYYYLRDDTVHSFKPGAPHAMTRYQTIKLRDIRAIDRLNMLPIKFNPNFEDVAINKLEVYDDKNRLIGEGNIDEYFIRDANDGLMLSDDKLLLLAVPGLQKKARIELVYTVKDKYPRDQFPYTPTALWAFGAPKVRQSVSYFGESKHIQFQSTDEREPQPFDKGLYWVYEGITPPKYEFMTRYRPEDLPTLTLAPKVSDTWEGLGLNYLEDVKERLPIEPATKELAEKITLGAGSEEEKIERLARFVQREIDYEAIEFGHRAWLMNTPQKILKDRFGDCKDHSILLWQLLRSIGIDAHMALIHNEIRLNKKFPAMSQFNHMIVYAPGYKGGRMIDLTGKHTPPTMPVPFGLQGKTALVLHPDKPFLKSIGEYPVTREGIYIDRSVEVTRVTHDMIIKERVSISGINAVGYRQFIAGYRPEEYKDLAMRMFGDEQNRFRPIRMEAENVNDPSKPLIIELDYSYNRVFRNAGNKLIGTLPTTWERRFFRIEPVDDRETFFGNPQPLLMQVKINIKSPFGFRVKTDRDLNQRVNTPSLRFATQSNATKNGLTISTAIVETPGYYPPEQFEAYYKAVMDFRITTAAEITLDIVR